LITVPSKYQELFIKWYCNNPEDLNL